MSEICKRCAECCKNFPFVDLSKKEMNSLEEVTGEHSDVYANQKGKGIEEYFLQFQDNGYCHFLNENDGNFSCGVYETRPGICKNYPSKLTEKVICDANSEKFLSNILR